MPNYRNLTSSLNFSCKNVVVVGGTAGIGAGIALRFAELGASVLIVGRNQKAGDEVVERMKKFSGYEDARFAFAQRDLSTLEEIKAAAGDVSKWAGADGVHYLLQSQGGPSMNVLPVTVENMTKGFNVQILSHFLIPYLLLSGPEPALRKGAQICTIGRPGEKNRSIDLDDFRCLKAIEAGTFKIFPAAFSFAFMTDLSTQEFNIRFPDTHTTHVYPGAVATDLFYHPSLPWWLRATAPLLSLFSRSPAQYADVAVWEIASEEAKVMKRAFWDQNGKEVEVDQRVWSDSQLREAIWAQLMRLSDL